MLEFTFEVLSLKIAIGAVDARKWNISDIFFSLNSIDGRKQQRQPETFVPCVGTMPLERAWQENVYLILKRIVLKFSHSLIFVVLA